MKYRVWLLLSLTLTAWTGTAFAAIETEFATPSPALLEEIDQALPPGQEVQPALLDFQVDPNLHLFHEAQIKVTFLGESAGLKNSFGYFLYQDLDGDGKISDNEISSREVLWANTSKAGDGGTLVPGDTMNLGKFPPGTRMGFFLIADGFNGGKETYYTLDQRNSDGHRHLAMLATADREALILGIEDLPWLSSDRDFNDLLFTVSVDPKSALLEVIDAGHIPVDGEQANPTGAAENPAMASQGAAENSPAVPSSSTALAPVYLEGSGHGCSLFVGNPAMDPAESWKISYHWIALLFAYAKWRQRKA